MITKLIKPKYTREKIENIIKDCDILYSLKNKKPVEGSIPLLACKITLIIECVVIYILSLTIMNDNSEHIRKFLNFKESYRGIIESSGALILLGKYLTYLIIMLGVPLIIMILTSKIGSLIIKKVFKETISQQNVIYEQNAAILSCEYKLKDIKDDTIWSLIDDLGELLNINSSIEIVRIDKFYYIKYLDNDITNYISISHEIIEKAYKNNDTLDFSFVDQKIEEILQNVNQNEKNSIIQGGYYGKRLC